MLLRRDVVRAERMPEYGAFRATETERVPAAYLIPAELGEVLDRLAVHGIRTEALAEDRELEVEEFRITSSRQAEEEFYDPVAIRHQLEEVQRLREEGSLTEEEAIMWEDELIERLMVARDRPREE